MGTRKPVLVRFRSSNLYVLITVAMSLFTDMLVYSIIIPITLSAPLKSVPFVVDALQNGRSPDSGPDPYHNQVSSEGSVSISTGILLALFSGGLLIGSPVLGYLADRTKYRQWPMVSGITGLLGATLLFLFANSYWQLLLARFLQGFSDACVWTLGMCLIADTFPLEELGTQMGRVLVFHSVGVVCGSPIGALYQKAGYKAPFIFCICLAGIDLLLRLFLVERRNRPPEWFEDDATLSKEPPICPTLQKDTSKMHHIALSQLLSHHRLISALILAFTNGIVCSLFEPTLTVHLSIQWGYNSSQIGLVFLAGAIPTIIAAPTSGYFADRFGSKIVCVTTLIICSVTVVLMGIPNRSTTGGVAPLIAIFAIQAWSASSFIIPALPEIAQVVRELNPDDGDSGQAISYAIFNIAFALGGLVGPLLGSFLYDRVGFAYMCLVVAGLLIVCVPYIAIFTGERGKWIVRPQDKATPTPTVRDEEKIAGQSNNATK